MARAASRSTRLPGDGLLTVAKAAGYSAAVVTFTAGVLASAAASAYRTWRPGTLLALDGDTLFFFGGLLVAVAFAVAVYIAARNARWYAGASAATLFVVAALLVALAAVLLAAPRLIADAEGPVVVREGGGLSDVAAAGLGLLLAAALAGLAAALTLVSSARRHA